MRASTLSLILFMTSTGNAASPALSPEIASALQNAVDRGSIRAVAAGVYADGETRVVGFGRLGRDDERVPDGDTAFEIGSISKVFTALLTQVQADAGRLTWDDTIAGHLPAIEFRNPAIGQITLRELASHTSGLPRIPDNMQPEDPLNPYAGYGREDLLGWLAAFDPAGLEKRYEYSNLGAGLLGLIAGDVAGPGYAEALARDVLRPLGMTDSAAGIPDALRSRLAAGFSQGADMPNWTGFDALAGAGAIVSTADDLLAFLRRNLEGGKLSAALEAVREPQGSGETALGWHIHEVEEGDRVFWHNGGTGGYASFLAMRPATRSGVVLLTTSTEYGPVTELGMAQITGGSLRPEGVDLRPYAGAYRLAEGLVLTVFVEGGRLFGQATGQAAFALTPAGGDEFVYPAADIRVLFDRRESGPAPQITYRQGGRTIVAPRVSDDQGVHRRTVIDVDAGDLGDYAGRYLLAPGVTITVTVHDGQLFAQLTGQTAFPVFPYEPDRFFYRVVDAQLHFERNDEDKVDAVVLHQTGEQRAPKLVD